MAKKAAKAAPATQSPDAIAQVKASEMRVKNPDLMNPGRHICIGHPIEPSRVSYGRLIPGDLARADVAGWRDTPGYVLEDGEDIKKFGRERKVRLAKLNNPDVTITVRRDRVWPTPG